MRKSNGIMVRISRVSAGYGRRLDGKEREGLGGIHNPGNLGGMREIPFRFAKVLICLVFMKDSEFIDKAKRSGRF